MSMPSAARRCAWGLVAASLLAGSAWAEVPARNMEQLAHLDQYPVPPPGIPYAYSACWSYIHGDGREYAMLGVATGTAIYNVTDPANTYRVGFIPGPTSIWREMKSYRNWIYIVTEGTGFGEGLQIVRMTNPESPVLAASYTTNFTHSHTVSVDTTRALLVCNGTRDLAGNAAGMHVLSLADPEAPVELARWPAGSGIVSSAQYVHDCVLVGNRLYASSVYVGIERVLDLTNPGTPTEVAAWSYPSAYYTHSAWPDASGRWLYVTDEQNSQTLRVFDIQSLVNPPIVNEFTCNPAAIVHNPRVQGSTLYLANYTEGVRVLDLSDPVHPAEFAWIDTYPGLSGGYGGVWDVCPYFPSGTVVASDMESGLYVFRPQASYGLLRARVVDGLGQPIAGQTVVLPSQGDSLRTPADGIVQFAPSPGFQSVTARRFGFFDAQASRTVSVGTRDTVTLTMIERPSAPVTGTVTDALTHAPIEDAEVTLTYTPRHAHTDALGHYDLGPVPDHFYQVEVRRAGYVPSVGLYDLGSTPIVHDVALDATHTWDALESASGWTVGAPGDNASSGVWVRVSPLGTGPPPAGPVPGAPAASRLAGPLHEEPASTSWGNAQPYTDHTPGAGTQCFVTGQGTNSADADQADVDFGITTLTSPALDLTGMARPMIDYWRWFYSWYGSTGQPEPDDWLAAFISNDNGATWVAVDTTRGAENAWEEQTIEVARFLTPTAQMRLRFIAADRGFPSIVEAALDDITTYDAGYGPLGVPPAAGHSLRFRSPWPNPATGAVTLVLELPAAGPAEVELIDTAGRRVRTLYRGSAPAGPLELRWDGTADDGRLAPPGLYFARARWGRSEARARFARLR
jgi:choice-of-anchor B domain-containing protein